MALGLLSVKIQNNNCFCGVSLNKLNLPKNCFLLGLVRESQIILASSEPTIYCGDELLAMTLSSTLIPALKCVLLQTHPIYYSLNDCFVNNLHDVPSSAEK
jgi:Trk K+ transport system NAD-binding subunit